MRGDPNRKFILTERDKNLLLFLWKWKLGTTRALAAKFFPGWKITSAYNRLQILRRGGVIQYCAVERNSRDSVWTLTSFGFHSIQEELGELVRVGYVPDSERHDLNVMAMHLGPWLVNRPEGVELVSEQEIKRREKSTLPDWVPTFYPEHFPDGYWLVPYKNEFILAALEVEISPKSSSRYKILAKQYRDCASINRVVWMVENESLGKRIYKCFKEEIGQAANTHVFILEEDFKKSGWGAKVFLGEDKEHPIAYSICGGQRDLINQIFNSQSVPIADQLLNCLKYPANSVGSAPQSAPAFSDRMALQPYTDSQVSSSTITSPEHSPMYSQAQGKPRLKEEK